MGTPWGDKGKVNTANVRRWRHPAIPPLWSGTLTALRHLTRRRANRWGYRTVAVALGLNTDRFRCALKFGCLPRNILQQ